MVSASSRVESSSLAVVPMQFVSLLDYCVNNIIFGCLTHATKTTEYKYIVVPMESVSLRLYSDAYPCHRVPTHGLISVI